jgi:hypothetical protein
MPIRQELIGTGLTTRIRTTVDLPGGAPEAAAMQALLERLASASTFDGLTAPWETVAREILARAGLPLVDRKVRVDSNGGWTDDLPDDWFQRPLEILRPGERPGDAMDLAESRYGIDSQEWYAAKILKAIDFVRTLARRQGAESTAVQAVHLGILITTCILKFAWEPAAVSGQKLGRDASQGGHARAAKRRPVVEQRYTTWRKEAADIWAKNPSLSKSQVARRIGQKLGDNYNTIRSKIDKPSQ